MKDQLLCNQHRRCSARNLVEVRVHSLRSMLVQHIAFADLFEVVFSNPCMAVQ